MDTLTWPTLKERWDICETYLKDKGATDQSKTSFDAFIDRELRYCIYEHFNININIGVDLTRSFKVSCTNVTIQKPVCLNNDIDIAIPEKIQANATLCRLLRSSLVSPVSIFQRVTEQELMRTKITCNHNSRTPGMNLWAQYNIIK